MSLLPLEFHPDAVAEAHAAGEWYKQRSEAAGAAFLAELDHAVELISRSPRRWPPYLHGTRRYLLHRFPFSVVYRERPDALTVVAVAHARRRPGYWKSR
ncbi:MAG: type II toxin-antitoxin system RelE/ParE family toxin [Nitrospiraceae bacterium]